MISNKTKISLVIILTILPVIVLSQNYARIDSIVRIYPEDYKTPQQLAKKIEEDFSTQIEKARAIFTWVAENIEYDVSGINKTDKFSYRTDLTVEEYTNEYSKWMLKLAKKTLRKGKGVCRHYANLYAITAFYCGIDCYIIEGRAKNPETFGKLPKQNHAWNAVKIGSSWYLLDVTWGAGVIFEKSFTKKFNDFFFLTPPEQLITTHWPKNERWNFTNLSLAEYINGPGPESYFYDRRKINASQRR